MSIEKWIIVNWQKLAEILNGLSKYSVMLSIKYFLPYEHLFQNNTAGTDSSPH